MIKEVIPYPISMIKVSIPNNSEASSILGSFPKIENKASNSFWLIESNLNNEVQIYKPNLANY